MDWIRWVACAAAFIMAGCNRQPPKVSSGASSPVPPTGPGSARQVDPASDEFIAPYLKYMTDTNLNLERTIKLRLAPIECAPAQLAERYVQKARGAHPAVLEGIHRAIEAYDRDHPDQPWSPQIDPANPWAPLAPYYGGGNGNPFSPDRVATRIATVTTPGDTGVTVPVSSAGWVWNTADRRMFATTDFADAEVLAAAKKYLAALRARHGIRDPSASMSGQ